MKDMDPLEKQLHSWQPRRPSARLKRRLFAAPASFMPKAAWLLGSLAPAVACVLLTLSFFNAGNIGNSSHQEPVVAMILSNQNYAAYASDNFRGAQNNLSTVTFDWTNHNGFTSSMAPF